MTYTQDELQVLFSKVRGTRKRLSIPKAANTTLKLLSDLLTRCYEEKWDPDLSCVIDKASEEERKKLSKESYYGLLKDLMVLMYDTPYEDLPLHVSDRGPLHRDVVNWRLEIGK